MAYRVQFYRSVSDLVQANAGYTLDYLIGEGLRLERELRDRSTRPLVLWPEDCRLICEVLTNPDTGKVLLDPHGIVLWANEALASWVRHRPNDLIGRCLWDVSKSPENDERRQNLANTLATGRMHSNITRNSLQQPIQTCTVPLPVPGAPCALVICKILSRERVFIEAFKDDVHLIE